MFPVLRPTSSRVRIGRTALALALVGCGATSTFGEDLRPNNLPAAFEPFDGRQTTRQLAWQEAPQWQAEVARPVANQYVLRESAMAAQYQGFLQASEHSVKKTTAQQEAVLSRWRSFNAAKQNTTKHRHLRTPPQVRNSTVSGSQFQVMAQQHLQQAGEMFGRGMPLSGRKHAEQALHQFALATDAQAGSNLGSKSLAAGMNAIREAGDFLGRFGKVDPNAIQRLVDSHQTPVLKNCDLTATSTFQAADAYFEFARIQLGRMNRQWPEASVAIEMIARTEAIANRQSKEITMASRTCLLRAAVDCNPENADALLALGTILSGTGVYDEATTALELCYARNQSPEALRMLASLHQRMGNRQLAQLCEAQLRNSQANKNQPAKVYQLPPEEFSKRSPQVIEEPIGRIATASYQSMPDQQSVVPEPSKLTRDLTRPQSSAEPSWAKRVIQKATNPVRSIFR